MHKLVNLICVSTPLLIVFAIPVFSPDPYFLHVLTLLWLNIIMTTGVWLLYITDEVSLANVSFMAIGAYSSAVLVKYAGVSFWISLPLAGMFAASISFLIGFPALRLKGFSFFIVTLGFAEIILIALSNYKQDILGGQTGIPAVPPPNPITTPLLTIHFTSKVSIYYLTLVASILCTILINKLVKSKFGRISMAISQAEVLTETLGIDTLRHRILAFTIVGFISGASGSLFAHSFSFVSPGDFSIHRMIMFICFIIIGGTMNIWGSIVGALVFTLLSVFFGRFSHIEVLITGIIVILILRFFPNGIIGFLDILKGSFSKIEH